jgi:serine protease Do
MQFLPSLRAVRATAVRSLVITVLLLAGCLGPAGVQPGASGPAKPNTHVALDRHALETIQAATFEVVVKKPAKDSLTYEKPLPFDLLPYSVRNDKYYSVGTAFAISPGQLVSAAHVLNLDRDSRFADFAVRDSNGNVYAVDQILKYSARRDFVVFSIKNGVARRILLPNTHPRLNEKVYAVGNALGQGIVIRDGLYTSNTPEERDGAWKWIRFSAAASPGNSGGPLLDENGKLIGIVQRKSRNENLNYALPIAEILNAKDHLAVLDAQIAYRIDNMPMTKVARFRREISLPKSPASLKRELVRIRSREGAKLMAAMFQENRRNIFPNGQGSTQLLHSVMSTFFPAVIARGDDGVWNVYKPDELATADLSSNGTLVTGDLGSSTYFFLGLPDNIALKDVANDSKRLMDLYLKGANYTRTVGPKRIKIVSMGKALEEHAFADSYRRKWMVKIWPIEFSDQKLVMMALPVPTGFVGMLRITDTGDAENHLRDMKALADFTYVSYYGTLARWRAFLAMKDMLPAAFSGIHVSFDYGKEFRYKSRRIAFSCLSTLMKITSNSDLQLGFSYFYDNGQVVWDVSKVVLGEDKNNSVAFTVIRNTKPTPNMNDNFLKDWDNLVHARHPYDQASYFVDDQTVIGTVFPRGADSRTLAKAPVLYSVMHSADGVVQQTIAATQLDGFIRRLAVREHRSTAGKRGKIVAKE